MSQYSLNRLSAIYKQPIKVGTETPHNEATKATHYEQQTLRATLCTKTPPYQTTSADVYYSKKMNDDENFDPFGPTKTAS